MVLTPAAGKRTVTFMSAPAPCHPRTSPTPNEAWRSFAGLQPAPNLAQQVVHGGDLAGQRCTDVGHPHTGAPDPLRVDV